MILNWLRAKSWSPYAAGAGLGLVAILALLLSQQTLGASGSFETVASSLLAATGSSLSENVYFRFVMPPGLTWQLVMVVGIIIGAFVSSKASGDFRWETAAPQWVEQFGPNRWKRWATMFAGGILLEYGAGIAGGCTSGLAISGSFQLAPAGFIFIAGLFASGIVTAKLLYGRNY